MVYQVFQHSPVENQSSANENYSGYVNPSPTSTISYPIEPELREHSSNPYRGGYDPITTYGRPLPPSDEICYPRSTPGPDVSFDDFDYASVPSPYGKDLPIVIGFETDVLQNEGEVTVTGAHDDGGLMENGRDGNYCDKIGQQTSYGSGLEAMDLCEIMLGYWPCLDKIERQQRDHFREICDQENRRDPWKLAAEYLFGSPVVYEYENYHHLQ
ncbi:hypothetical protein F511_21501 [Dorcoceras hygrometricum]|uniref:Uncharacterized protein n=1 Tax=Dorcoceras hygrometricum TaxID=472368 RepID=A0A2Z7D185_9LAMI|nr:hypothetical protein F511_21501 [Dorcoceras hygrometricum]